ncbi:MAG: two-component system alkaline phosphatase synthesis response regulator PhoP [bacterium]|jgi:two-component system alkaline phosphatase synthesis response regulator PhoP
MAKLERPHILVVEDEEDILELITFNLIKENFQVSVATDGQEALKKVAEVEPDLVLLDLMLPILDGTEVCKVLKSDPKTENIPVIMVTAKGDERDVIKGLEIGSDDYITKPFSPKILIARIRTVLRRFQQENEDSNETLSIHDLEIHVGKHEVLVKKKQIPLTLTEFRILYLLAKRPGWVFSRDQIVDAVRGDNYYVTDRSVDVQIVGLRKKLGSAGSYIQTVRGLGYRFKE